MMMPVILLAASYLVQQAIGEPTLLFPLNAQLPPVARIDHFFSYSLSSHTFRSESNITYSLANHPSWLSIESIGGRLYGTPEDDDLPPGDVVGQTVGLVATDNTGSTLMDATLVVSRSKGPTVQIPLSRQIKSLGPFSAPSSLLSYPSTDFEYTFDPDTFSTPHNLNYYATSNDSSPLPSWLRFDADALTFSGTTPAFESLVQPPQTFDISLVASDVVGFSAAWISFSIVVGRHRLTTGRPIIRLNVTKGDELSYDNLNDDIKLDNKPVAPGYLEASVENLPVWLTFDADNGRLHGVPRDNDHSANFIIKYRDKFQDTLSVLVQVTVSTGLFQTTFEDVDARPGEILSLDLKPYFRDPEDVELTVDLSPQEDWLRVDGFHLSGKVPKTANGDFDVTINVASKTTGIKETEKLHVTFFAADGTTPLGASSSPSSPHSSRPTTSSPARESVDKGKPHSSHLSTRKVLLASLLPVLLAALGISLLIFFTYRRRHRQRHPRNDISSKQRFRFPRAILSRLRTVKPFRASRPHIKAMTAIKKFTPPFFQPERSRPMMGDEAESQTRPMRESRPYIKAMTAIKQFSSPFFKPRKSRRMMGYNAETQTPVSHGPSQTLGELSVLEAPPAILASMPRSATVRSVSIQNDNIARDSWVTVDDTSTIARSQGSIRSCRSGVGLADVAHAQETECLPVDGAAAAAAASSIDDLSYAEPLALVVHKSAVERRSVGGQSVTTSSSAALPAFYLSNQWGVPKSLGKRPMQTPGDGEDREAAEDAASKRQCSDKLRRLSQQPWTSCPVLPKFARNSIVDRQSVVTVSSFESTENWRVIGRQDTARSLMNQDAQGRKSLELLSPSKWQEDDGDDDEEKTMDKKNKMVVSKTAKRDSKSRPPRMLPIVGSGLDEEAESISRDGEAVAKAILRALGEDSASLSEGSLGLFF